MTYCLEIPTEIKTCERSLTYIFSYTIVLTYFYMQIAYLKEEYFVKSDKEFGRRNSGLANVKILGNLRKSIISIVNTLHLFSSMFSGLSSPGLSLPSASLDFRLPGNLLIYAYL